mmetsp:Transcript_11877/g.27338  ORF Transcript_11877/g.27338 Transcript_11877/m.27338 type:complete len:268 (-) Transcript_11877:1746-2549(-)
MGFFASPFFFTSSESESESEESSTFLPLPLALALGRSESESESRGLPPRASGGSRPPSGCLLRILSHSRAICLVFSEAGRPWPASSLSLSSESSEMADGRGGATSVLAMRRARLGSLASHALAISRVRAFILELPEGLMGLSESESSDENWALTWCCLGITPRSCASHRYAMARVLCETCRLRAASCGTKSSSDSSSEEMLRAARGFSGRPRRRRTRANQRWAMSLEMESRLMGLTFCAAQSSDVPSSSDTSVRNLAPSSYTQGSSP